MQTDTVAAYPRPSGRPVIPAQRQVWSRSSRGSTRGARSSGKRSRLRLAVNPRLALAGRAGGLKIRRLKLGGFKRFVDPAELGSTGADRRRRTERLRQVQPARSHPLGDGRASPKSLRGGGMEDVIFAGTATRPARDFAEVSLLIDGQRRRGSWRRRKRSHPPDRARGGLGLSDQRARCPEKDVSLLFADAATGAHSPALVSQGRIGAVIAAKPVERRAMLEEAAGIAGLHVRRKDAEQKLRATEANLRGSTSCSPIRKRAPRARRQAERPSAIGAERQIRTTEARMLYARWAEPRGDARGRPRKRRRRGGRPRLRQAHARRAGACRHSPPGALAAGAPPCRGAQRSGRNAGARSWRRTRRARHGRSPPGRTRPARRQRGHETAREDALATMPRRALAALDAEPAAMDERLADAEAPRRGLPPSVNAADAGSRGTQRR